MCLFRSGCNTVPIEKGTETFESDAIQSNASGCNTVPIEKGTETRDKPVQVRAGAIDADATPSPSRRGLKPTSCALRIPFVCRCNTVPIEKGTETHKLPDQVRAAVWMQHRPHREGD